VRNHQRRKEEKGHRDGDLAPPSQIKASASALGVSEREPDGEKELTFGFHLLRGTGNSGKDPALLSKFWQRGIPTSCANCLRKKNPRQGNQRYEVVFMCRRGEGKGKKERKSGIIKLLKRRGGKIKKGLRNRGTRGCRADKRGEVVLPGSKSKGRHCEEWREGRRRA